MMKVNRFLSAHSDVLRRASSLRLDGSSYSSLFMIWAFHQDVPMRPLSLHTGELQHEDTFHVGVLTTHGRHPPADRLLNVQTAGFSIETCHGQRQRQEGKTKPGCLHEPKHKPSCEPSAQVADAQSRSTGLAAIIQWRNTDGDQSEWAGLRGPMAQFHSGGVERWISTCTLLCFCGLLWSHSGRVINNVKAVCGSTG